MKHSFIIIITFVFAINDLLANVGQKFKAKNRIDVENKISVKGDVFQIETLGRKGAIEFSSLVNDQPKSAKIKLYGFSKSDVSEYNVINGNWSGNIFTGHITKGDNSEIQANLPGLVPGKYGLKIKITKGTYKIVGVITSINELEQNVWASLKTKALILGYNSDVNLFPQKAEAKNFALVINDKHASEKKGEYSYGWYIEPYVTITKNYRAVHIVKDELLNEFALYAFGNSDFREEKGLEKFRVKFYKYKEIGAQLSGLFNEFKEKDLKPDIVALLVNEAQMKYPSETIGMKSSGHGSSVGIMNGFLENESSIKHALSLIKAFNSKPIDFLDFSTNCNVASLYNLIAVASYVTYVVASDLTRNSPNPTIGKRPDDGPNYANYFNDTNQKIPEILGAMMDSYESLYNEQKTKSWYLSTDALKYGNTLSGWKQQLTLFDMTKFPEILKNIGGEKAYEKCTQGTTGLTQYYYPEESWKQIDFKTAIPIVFPSYKSFSKDWDAFVIKQISNKKGLKWDTNAPNGLILNTK